ncbi:MAG: right-handed parallel beta-helix repeat-containing protein [Ruminococcaceae bacterium]|nr:right-handed parallel beta-helix repeat-containing protein [Oscillospiraceae bacterium]
MRKNKILSVILSLIMLSPSLVRAEEEKASPVWKEVYVSLNGSDNAQGTKEAPFQTIAKAQEYVRTISNEMQGDIIVNVEKGTYFIDNPLHFTTEDSGKNGYRIIYKGEGMPVISGGVKVGVFEKSEHEGIWKAPVEGVTMMREMYVNDKKAYVASSNRQIFGTGYYNDPKTSYDYDGMYISRSDIGDYENAEDIEFAWQRNWKLSTSRVKDIIPDPENPDQVIALMAQSWWNDVASAQYNDLRGRYDVAFLVKNAFELLDKPGEFYYNKKEKTVYYIPREGENMTTAEVIAPKQSRLITFDGRTENNRVENITIKGFKIAHGAFYGMDDTAGFEIAQQQNVRTSNDAPWTTPALIAMDRTENIEFLDNYFFGLGAVGIYMFDAVDGTVIRGNAFSDIADAAIAIGWAHHGGVGATYESVQIKPPADSGLCNLITEKTKASTSYYDNFAYITGGLSWVTDADIAKRVNGGAWRSDPYAPKNGEKSWVRYDFETKYNITNIKLAFSKNVENECRQGYEVLLSNDREFKEGSYVVVATQDTPASNLASYDFDSNGEKYRYLMIRTLAPTKFAISGVWAFTPDREPYASDVPSRNNTIDNNYITRTGETICGGGGISTFYTKGLTVTNNELSNIPYSAIMFGWGWNNKAEGSGDNYIARNYIHNVNKTMHDGAAIYCLSVQRGTIIEENYIRDDYVGEGGVYPDEGSSYALIRRNVTEDVLKNYNLWISTVREITIKDNYGWHNVNRNDGTMIELEDVQTYLPGNDVGDAYEIKQNAGLEPEYEYLRDLVPVHEPDLVEEPRVIIETQTDHHIKELTDCFVALAKDMLENGSFGYLPGDYPIQYKFKLQDACDEVEYKEGVSNRYSYLKLRKIINEMADNVIRVPLNELIALCDKALNLPVSANRGIEGTVSKKAMQNFKDKYIPLKARSEQNLSVAEERDLLLEIEPLYKQIMESKSAIGIKYLYVEEMIDEKVDKENKTITVLMPANANISSQKTEVLCEGTSTSAVFEENLNYERDFSLPVYSKDMDKYEYWQIKVVHDCNNSLWNTVAEESNTAVKADDGNVFLSINKAPYVSGKYFSENTVQTVKFVPKTASEGSKVNLIFAANSALEFDNNTKELKNDHFRLEIENGLANVYERELGEERLIKKGVEFPLMDNVENNIRISCLPVRDKTIIVIWLNGELVTNVLAEREANSGYIGFFNEKTGVKVIE